MFNKKAMLSLFLGIMLILVLPVNAHARCTSTGATQIEDNRAALLSFGRVNMADTYFQPIASTLSSIVVPSTSYKYVGATAINNSLGM